MKKGVQYLAARLPGKLKGSQDKNGYFLSHYRYAVAIHEGAGKHVAAAIRQLSKDIHG